MNAVRQLFGKKPAAPETVKAPRKRRTNPVDDIPLDPAWVSANRPQTLEEELNDEWHSGDDKPGGAARKAARIKAALAAKADKDRAKSKAERQYITRQQLDSLVGAFAAVLAQVERAAAASPGSLDSRLSYRLGIVARAPAEFGLSSTEAGAFERLVSLIDGASDKQSARDRYRASNPDDSWHRRPPPI